METDITGRLIDGELFGQRLMIKAQQRLAVYSREFERSIKKCCLLGFEVNLVTFYLADLPIHPIE